MTASLSSWPGEFPYFATGLGRPARTEMRGTNKDGVCVQDAQDCGQMSCRQGGKMPCIAGRQACKGDAITWLLDGVGWRAAGWRVHLAVGHIHPASATRVCDERGEEAAKHVASLLGGRAAGALLGRGIVGARALASLRMRRSGAK